MFNKFKLILTVGVLLVCLACGGKRTEVQDDEKPVIGVYTSDGNTENANRSAKLGLSVSSVEISNCQEVTFVVSNNSSSSVNLDTVSYQVVESGSVVATGETDLAGGKIASGATSQYAGSIVNSADGDASFVLNGTNASGGSVTLLASQAVSCS